MGQSFRSHDDGTLDRDDPVLELFQKSELAVHVAVRFKHLCVDCRPETVSAAEITRLLGDAERYFRAAAQRLSVESAARARGHGAEQPPLLAVQLGNMRVRWRRAASLLIERAVWLEPEASRALQRFVEAQPELLPHPRYRFSVDWVTPFASQWRAHLAHLEGKPGLRFLEVGSYEGGSACWMLDNILTHPSSALTCIDLFAAASPDGPFRSNGIRHSPAALFDDNISRTGAATRVRKLAGRSQEILRTLPLESYDYVYVDGAQKAPDVLTDAVLAFAVAKPGALLTFNEYEAGPSLPGTGLRVALDAFQTANAGRFEVVRRGFQLTIRKLGQD